MNKPKSGHTDLSYAEIDLDSEDQSRKTKAVKDFANAQTAQIAEDLLRNMTGEALARSRALDALMGRSRYGLTGNDRGALINSSLVEGGGGDDSGSSLLVYTPEYYKSMSVCEAVGADVLNDVMLKTSVTITRSVQTMIMRNSMLTEKVQKGAVEYLSDFIAYLICYIIHASAKTSHNFICDDDGTDLFKKAREEGRSAAGKASQRKEKVVIKEIDVIRVLTTDPLVSILSAGAVIPYTSTDIVLVPRKKKDISVGGTSTASEGGAKGKKGAAAKRKKGEATGDGDAKKKKNASNEAPEEDSEKDAEEKQQQQQQQKSKKSKPNPPKANKSKLPDVDE